VKWKLVLDRPHHLHRTAQDRTATAGFERPNGFSNRSIHCGGPVSDGRRSEGIARATYT
jgi:hypothetical protein